MAGVGVVGADTAGMGWGWPAACNCCHPASWGWDWYKLLYVGWIDTPTALRACLPPSILHALLKAPPPLRNHAHPSEHTSSSNNSTRFLAPLALFSQSQEFQALCKR